MSQYLIQISSKKFTTLRNLKSLKLMVLTENIRFICHSNTDFNKSIEKKKSRFLLDINRWPTLQPKSLLISRMNSTTESMDELTFERISEQTLEHLYEEFEAILEKVENSKDIDVSLNNGVITLNLGKHGTYVINKQTPNKQIWFSSPLSGPKRYDYINKQWIYKRDGIPLFSLLSSELSVVLKREIKINYLIL